MNGGHLIGENYNPGRRVSLRFDDQRGSHEMKSLTFQPWTPDHDGEHILAIPPNIVTPHETIG